MQVILYILQVRVGGRVIGKDNGFQESRHASERKTMPQVVRKERIGRVETMLEEKRIEGIRIIRVRNALKNRRMVGSGKCEGGARNNREREIGVRKRKRTGDREKIFRKSWHDTSRRERGVLCSRKRNTSGGGPLCGGRHTERWHQGLGCSS